MPTRRPTLFLSLSLVFVVHNAEEAIFAPAMLTFLQTRAPAFLRAFYAGVSVSQLRTGLLLLSLIGVGVGLLAARAAALAFWSYVMLVFGGIMGLNAVAHIVLALAAGQYMPGLATALALSLPFVGILFLRAWRERWVSAATLWTVPVVALVVHGPLLAVFLELVVVGR